MRKPEEVRRRALGRRGAPRYQPGFGTWHLASGRLTPATAVDPFGRSKVAVIQQESLRRVLEQAGLEVEQTSGTGFPFFNLYKLVVLLHGEALVKDASSASQKPRIATLAMRCFATLLHPSLNSARRGWQLAALTETTRLTRPQRTRTITDVTNSTPNQLQIKIFTDGANVAQMLELAADPLVKGFTTNPTLMSQAGVEDYATFVKELTARITDAARSPSRSISDDFSEMERQALALRDLGDNVYVKIPITDTSRQQLGSADGSTRRGRRVQ